MEDLASMITQFLGSEEGMSQLRAVSAALGMGDPAAPPPLGGQNAAAGGQGGPAFGQGAATPGFAVPNAASSQAPGLDLNTLMLMQRAASTFGQDDRNTELLRALKPHFSPERAKKVDDAIRIIQLIRLLPLAKEMGLFDRLKGGGK